MQHFKHRYTLPIIIILFIFAIFALGVAFFNIRHNTTVPREANMSILGVELDQNKDNVDLNKLQQKGISFIYLRATQGKSYFDDNFLLYRDKVKGTSLAYGTIIAFSNQSTVDDQYQYFISKVGNDTGNLPVMIVPAVDSQSDKYWKSMAKFSNLLINLGKKVLIVSNYDKKGFFNKNISYLYTGASLKDKKNYAFWCYTQTGRVKDIENLEANVTMFAYIGSMAEYQEFYGANSLH